MAIKVLIIDDSALVRKIFTQELAKDPEIEVVGSAVDPIAGRDKIVELRPDVITLDVEMPRMDGLTFLEKLMKHYPMPVVVVSSLAQKGGEVALRAIELGAVEVIAKPGTSYSTADMAEQLIAKVKAAACAKNLGKAATPTVAPVKIAASSNAAEKQTVETHTPIVDTIKPSLMNFDKDKIIAIGASTGGTEAIKEVLSKMPANCPPIVMVQHMPQNFTAAFAKRMDSLCAIKVVEAQNGEKLEAGKAILAPGNKHMEIVKGMDGYHVTLLDGPMLFHQRPAVEVLFNSMAKVVGKNAVGAILTGMGRDGAKGLLNMKTAGAKTIAQDEKTCVVFGMPKEAIACGGVDLIKPIHDIATTLIALCKQN